MDTVRNWGVGGEDKERIKKELKEIACLVLPCG